MTTRDSSGDLSLGAESATPPPASHALSDLHPQQSPNSPPPPDRARPGPSPHRTGRRRIVSVLRSHWSIDSENFQNDVNARS